jgi:hypothetical protein
LINHPETKNGGRLPKQILFKGCKRPQEYLETGFGTGLVACTMKRRSLGMLNSGAVHEKVTDESTNIRAISMCRVEELPSHVLTGEGGDLSWM